MVQSTLPTGTDLSVKIPSSSHVDHFEKFKVTCKKCGKPCVYRVNVQKVPKRPRKTCPTCKARFCISRKKLILKLKKINSQKKKNGSLFEKSQGKNQKNGSLFEKSQILKLLAKHLSLKEIARKMSLSYIFLWRFVKELESKKYIKQVSNYPLLYDLDHAGKIYVARLKNHQKKIQLKNHPRPKTKKLNLTENKLRIHDVRLGYDPKFGSWPHELISIPLGKSRVDEIKWGDIKYKIHVKRVLQNPKTKQFYFIFYFPDIMFDGLTTARVYRPTKKNYADPTRDTKSVQFIFDRKRVDPKSEYVDVDKDSVGLYLQDRINDTIKAQVFLERNYGIKVENKDNPEWVKDPHFEIHYKDGTFDDIPLSKLDAYFEEAIQGRQKLENGAVVWHDDSPKTGDGNLETEDLDIALVLGKDKRPPNAIDNRMKINDLEKSLPQQISNEIMKSLNQFKVDFTKEVTQQMSKAVGDAVSTALKQAFTTDKDVKQGPSGGNGNPLTI